MAIYGGTGACLAFGATYQIGSEVTVINDTGEVYVNFKIPVRSNTSDTDPNQTLSQALTDLNGDADDTLYEVNTLNNACQILVNLYGNYYEGCSSAMFNIQTHHTDQLSPTNRVKITKVWSVITKTHSSHNPNNTYPRIISANTATGEYRLNVGTGGSDPEYWSNITFDMYLLNGSGAAPYVGNQTYDNRYGQDQAWK
jgi:hypothetical protein